MELDRAIRAAEENREAINYTLFDRRDEVMARIFTTPAAGLAGLAVQARAYLSEREVEFAEDEGEVPLDFSHMGAVLAVPTANSKRLTATANRLILAADERSL